MGLKEYLRRQLLRIFKNWWKISIQRFKKPSSVRFSHSVVSDSLWPQGLQHAGLPGHHQLPELTQTHVHWVGDVIQPSHPLSSLLLPPSIFPSIRVFSNESVLHIRWPKYWSFSFSNSLSNEYSGLISFRMDWLDLLSVQGTLKNLFQHHSSKASTHPDLKFRIYIFLGNIISFSMKGSSLLILWHSFGDCLFNKAYSII